MNPFVFMPPFASFDQFELARERAAMLKEEWRLANAKGPGRPGRGPGAFTRIRRAAGHALVALGSRLAPPASSSPAVSGTVQRTGC
jgi:hypothetical protein